MTMRQLHITYAPADESTTGIAAALLGAGPWDASDFTSDGPNDEMAHHLTLTSGSDLSGLNFTITGVGIDGATRSEVLAGPNANTVVSTQAYLSIISVASSGDTTPDTFDIGWDDFAACPTIPLEVYLTGGHVNVQVQLTGTADYDVQTTLSELCPDPNNPPQQGDYLWTVDPSFDGETTSMVGILAFLATAMRVLLNSYSSGAELKVSIISPL